MSPPSIGTSCLLIASCRAYRARALRRFAQAAYCIDALCAGETKSCTCLRRACAMDVVEEVYERHRSGLFGGYSAAKLLPVRMVSGRLALSLHARLSDGRTGLCRHPPAQAVCPPRRRGSTSGLCVAGRMVVWAVGVRVQRQLHALGPRGRHGVVGAAAQVAPYSSLHRCARASRAGRCRHHRQVPEDPLPGPCLPL